MPVGVLNLKAHTHTHTHTRTPKSFKLSKQTWHVNTNQGTVHTAGCTPLTFTDQRPTAFPRLTT